MVGLEQSHAEVEVREAVGEVSWSLLMLVIVIMSNQSQKYITGFWRISVLATHS